jgi:hypothetical protein
MDLQEQVNSLNAEKIQLLNFVENINAEKIALDQLLVESLKSSVSTKKELFLVNAKATKLEQENNDLKARQIEMQKNIDQLTNEVHILASEAQSSGG